MQAIWSKTNGRGQLIELRADPNSTDGVELWVSGERQSIYGAKAKMFEATKNSDIFAFSGTKYGLSKSDKQQVEQAISNVRTAHKQAQALWQQELEAEIAKYPGLKAAMAKYGTREQAHAAEDVAAADLLLQWEMR